MLNELIDTEFLTELRREAFIRAVENSLEEDNVAGVFSPPDIELKSILEGYGLLSFPLEDVDAHIFKYGNHNDKCDVIRSTLIYLKTDKCPILASAKMYIFNYCRSFYEYFKESLINSSHYRDKTAVYIEPDHESFKSLHGEIVKLYGRSFSSENYEKARKELMYIDGVLELVDSIKEISMEEAFLLRYYTDYMPLKERNEYFSDLNEKLNTLLVKNSITRMEGQDIVKIYAQCPRGALKSISEVLKETDDDIENTSRVRRVYMGKGNLELGFEKCIYKNNIQINYEV